MQHIKGKLQTMGVAFSAIFKKAFGGVESHMNKIATIVPSSTSSNEYAWLGAFPSMRKWVGDKIVNEFSGHSYTIKNEPWELTIGVHKHDIDDDNLGIYTPMVSELGSSAIRHQDDLVFNALKNGTSKKCYDGQYYFDTDHPVNGKSVSNYFAGGQPLWTILDTSRSIKPIIFQERQKPEFSAVKDSNDAQVFLSGRYMYGVEARYNVGYGFWQMAVASAKDLTAANFGEARLAMRKFTNDEGAGLGLSPTVIVVHPDLEVAAEKLFATKTLDGGGDNSLYGKVEIIVADKWV